MRYFVFDLDETLVEIYPVSYFITSLRLMADEDRSRFLYVPKYFNQSLEKAYRFFIDAVLDAEKKDPPLGLLRPGILEVMRTLQRMREQKLLDGVMIYSNNPNLAHLEFVADLIHEHVRSKRLIRKCIHLHHALRENERYHHTNLISKTWDGVQHSLIHGLDAPHHVSHDDVYFFDDLDHIDLQNKLGAHYIKVPAYRHYASFTTLADLYRKAIVDAGVNQELFVALVCDMFHIPTTRYTMDPPTLDDLIEWFRLSLEIPRTDSESVVQHKDEGIERIWNVIHTIQPASLPMKRQKGRGVRTRKARRRTVRK